MADDEQKSDVSSEKPSSDATSPDLPDVSAASSAHSGDEVEVETQRHLEDDDLLDAEMTVGVAVDRREVSTVEAVTRKRFDGVEVVFVSQDTQTTSQAGSAEHQAKGDDGGAPEEPFSDERTEEELAVIRDQTHQSREQSVLTEDAVGTEALSREESIPLKKTTDEILEKPGFEFQANEKFVEFDPEAQEDDEDDDASEEEAQDRDDTYLEAGDDAETLVTEDSAVPPLRDLEGLDGCETVGPPRILRLNRESSKVDFEYPPLTDREKEDGIFGGNCDFCGNAIKSYPDMEKQLYKHSREIFCCDDYQMFMQFALQKPFGKKYDVDVQTFVTQLLDIQPHAPYNKQARKAAKEKAALRMRERELERQKKAVTQQQPQQQQQQQTYQQAAESQKALKVINFSLGSKKCAEQGYIVDAKPRDDLSLPLGVSISADLSSDVPFTERTVPLKNQFEQRFYATKKKRLFYVFFDDGTGTVYYKSGRPCIIISAVKKPKTAQQQQQKSQQGSKSERELTTQSKTHRSVAQTSRATSRKTAEGGPGLASTRRPTNTSVGGTELLVQETERRAQAANKLQYIVLSDEPRSSVLAVFLPDGSAACYDSNRQLRLHLSALGGILFGDNLSKKRKWNWHDFTSTTSVSPIDQQRSPPMQPLFLLLGDALSLKIINRHLLWLTFRSGKYNFRFNVGVRLKITGVSKTELPKMVETKKENEYLSDMQTYIQSILDRVNNLQRFKDEELAEKLPPPLYLSHQMEKRNIQPPPKYGSKKQQMPKGGRLLSQSIDLEENSPEPIRT